MVRPIVLLGALRTSRLALLTDLRDQNNCFLGVADICGVGGHPGHHGLCSDADFRYNTCKLDGLTFLRPI